VFSIIILFKAKVGNKNGKCGYLSIPLATNVASKEILLNTAGLKSNFATALAGAENINDFKSGQK